MSYVWPSKWSAGSTSSKYDYALLVLANYARDTSGDVQWYPAPYYVEDTSNTSIDYSKHNIRSYPGRSYKCSDAYVHANGKCDGFMFRQWGEVREAFSTWFAHKFDTNPGSSGAGIYKYNSSSGKRTVFGVHKGEYGSRNKAHHINSGSMGLICDVLEDSDYQSSYFPNFHC